MSSLFAHFLNGISFAMLLFLLAAGLSLIFGMMRILNLAHGSFYLLGAYVALTVIRQTNSFFLAAFVAPVFVGGMCILLHRFLFQRFYKERLSQVLLTFGLIFTIADLTLWIWGGTPRSIQQPLFLASSLHFGGIVFPAYRLFVIGVGSLIAVLMWLFIERTQIGAIVRAGVDDEEMVRGVGINMPFVFTAVFAVGGGLAGFAGVIGGPILGVYPGMDLEVMLLAFVVIIIGGMGSLKGAFVGSLVVGLIDNFGRALVPQFALFTVFVAMAIILIVRPRGLFGKEMG
jgi:branched-chain amino acid transport system permease protein